MAQAFKLNQEELTLIFNEIDQNGDGFIEADEWREFIFKTSNKNFVKNKIVDKLKDKEWVKQLTEFKSKDEVIADEEKDFNLEIEDELDIDRDILDKLDSKEIDKNDKGNIKNNDGNKLKDNNGQ